MRWLLVHSIKNSWNLQKVGFTFYKHVAVFFSRQLRIPASNLTKEKMFCLKYWINFHINIDCLYTMSIYVFCICYVCTHILCILQSNKNVLIEYKFFPWWEDLWCFEFKVERETDVATLVVFVAVVDGRLSICWLIQNRNAVRLTPNTHTHTIY